MRIENGKKLADALYRDVRTGSVSSYNFINLNDGVVAPRVATALNFKEKGYLLCWSLSLLF
jgi:hypothetical protein